MGYSSRDVKPFVFCWILDCESAFQCLPQFICIHLTSIKAGVYFQRNGQQGRGRQKRDQGRNLTMEAFISSSVLTQLNGEVEPGFRGIISWSPDRHTREDHQDSTV